jgi:hypothetical protein
MRTINRRVAVHAFAAVWSTLYLGLGLAWLFGAGGNPADPAVDATLADNPSLSLFGLWGPRASAAVLAGLALLGLVLSVLMVRPARSRPAAWAVTGAGVALGLTLAVVLPDFRLLAMIGYTPILAVLALVGALPDQAYFWPWPLVNLAVLSVAGLAFLMTASDYRRRSAPSDVDRRTPEAATRWGRGAVAVAVAVPVGYAITRFAWALGIPLGVTQDLLDELGNAVWVGAALGALALGGAVLTLGLTQRWGEVFPRWMPVVRGRAVPVRLATVPARLVAVVVASAGLMFVRLAVTGTNEGLPFTTSDIAAWLPEMFWPLWGAALAAAAYAYEVRRRATGGMRGPQGEASRAGLTGTPPRVRPAPEATRVARTGDRTAAPVPVPGPRTR